MKALVKAVIGGLAMVACAPPALAEDPASGPLEVELLIASDDCAGVTLEALGGEGFSLKFPDFEVKTSDAARRVRKLCYVQIKASASEGYCMRRSGFEVSGTVTMAREARHSNVSVRSFAPGDVGDDYFRILDDEASDRAFNGASEPSEPEGAEDEGRCEPEVRLSFIVDVTARSAARGSTSTTSVSIKEIWVPLQLQRM